MKMKNMNTHGISEVVSVILVIALILVLAMVIYTLLFGSLSLKQTSRVAATAGTVSVPTGATIIPIMYAQPASGDKYYLLGQSGIPSGYPVVYLPCVIRQEQPIRQHKISPLLTRTNTEPRCIFFSTKTGHIK